MVTHLMGDSITTMLEVCCSGHILCNVPLPKAIELLLFGLLCGWGHGPFETLLDLVFLGSLVAPQIWIFNFFPTPAPWMGASGQLVTM